MDARSTRYRSLDSKGTGPPQKTRERHNSVPNGDRQRSQQPRRQSATSKPKELSSKTTPHDDPSLTSPDRKSSGTRQSEGQHVSAEGKPGSKVCNRFPVLLLFRLSQYELAFTLLQVPALSVRFVLILFFSGQRFRINSNNKCLDHWRPRMWQIQLHSEFS